jgi:Zn finger protein HypA/HybF involved in hydrogenase expression
MTSRLSAYCVSCKREGSRNEFTSNPMLAEDECPNCSSDDVDIFDSKHSAAGDYSYDMSNMESN